MNGLEPLKKQIIFHMVREMSSCKYMYESMAEGCFDMFQRTESLQVPKEHLEEVKKDCVKRAIEIFCNR